MVLKLNGQIKQSEFKQRGKRMLVLPFPKAMRSGVTFTISSNGRSPDHRVRTRVKRSFDSPMNQFCTISEKTALFLSVDVKPIGHTQGLHALSNIVGR
jgi:hypothetical protein